MRPEKAYNIVTRAFNKFLKTNSIESFMNTKTKTALNKLLKKCIRLGDNADAYYLNDDNVMDNMHYISDRWCCSGRIKFMLHIINRG